MGLSNKKEDQLREQPIIKTRMWRSKSGNHFVFRTTITDIRPVSYVEKVLAGDESEEEMDIEEA